MSPDEEEKLFDLGLYRICSALHISANGSGDPLPDDVRDKYVEYLKYRIEKWTYHKHSVSFDVAMLALCFAALTDVERDLRDRQED